MEGAGGGAIEETVRVMYDRQRTLIVTSNIPWSDLPKTYARNAPLVSVIQRMCVPIALVNPQWPGEPRR